MVTTFYSTIAANQQRAYMPAAPIMVTATSYWSLGRRQSAGRRATGEILPVRIPAQVPEVAADSGGFVAATRMGGQYPFSAEQYIAWLRGIPRLSWAALPDLPVERQLASSRDTMRARQQLTLAYARELWGASTEHASVPWAWVPTIQGQTPDDYLSMARELADIMRDQLAAYDYTAYAYDTDDLDPELLAEAEHGARYRRVGIGSLCNRTSIAEIVTIVRTVAATLPGERFHLWGVKLSAIPALREAGLLDRIASLDSATWNGRRGPALELAKASPLSQAAHSWQVSWPAYAAKIDHQLTATPPAAYQPGLAI